jgi:4-hydroxy-tetrahydrodipicolinate reductase
MKIALIGYGKMGKAIELIARERGHEICITFSSKNILSKELLMQSKADVAIEFTQPHLATSHIFTCLESSIPVVVGTTAWQKELNAVRKSVVQKNGSLLYSSNFSVGVNILFKLNEVLAKLMNSQIDYEPSIEEVHHLQKLDAPSGTAVSLAEGMLQNLKSYENWTLIEHEIAAKNEIPIRAIRLPEVPGTHTICYDSPIDRLEIKHEAKNRTGFALGAVLAAEFLFDKKGVFTMSDVLNL